MARPIQTLHDWIVANRATLKSNEDVRRAHLHVSMQHGDRTYLGEVWSVRYDDGPSPGLRAQVRNFNGELWPMEPAAYALRLLPRRD